MTAVHTGDRLDHYRIEGVAARSGMASIFRGTDIREEIGSKLDHPGVMKVMRDADRSQLYRVMEWVDGRLYVAR